MPVWRPPLRSLVNLPYLWELRPYLRQVGGLLVIGSMMGIIMNTAIVLPPLMLGRAIDAVLAIERGEGDVGNRRLGRAEPGGGGGAGRRIHGCSSGTG